MGILSDIGQWNERRYKMIQARHDLVKLRIDHEQELHEKSLKLGSADYNRLVDEYYHDHQLASADLDELESDHLLRRARRWGVPIRTRPEHGEDNEEWDWSAMHRRHYLSAQGKSRIRRECFNEMEMFYKPWTTWLAVVISIISLVISIFRH